MKRVLSVLLVVGTWSVLVAAQGARTPEVLFKAAQHTEEVQGDLKAAIAQYKKVVDAGNRPLAAQALLRIAGCHQKLGDAEAVKVYQQILRDYTDQAEAISIARARLGGPRSAATGMVARQLWTTSGSAQVTITNDGRSVTVLDATTPDVQIRSLTTDQTTRLKVIADPASGGYAEWPVLSPDMKQIAYAYAGPDITWEYQLRIADAQSDAKPRSLGKTYPYLFVNGWSVDGKSVLVSVFEDGKIGRIAWLSAADGTMKTVKSLDWQDPGRPTVSPDGRFIAYDVRVEADKANRELRILGADGSGESVVAAAPGINASPVWSRDGSQLVFKSDRSGAFGIWSIPIRGGRADGAPTRLKADVGDIELLGFTEAGALLYELATGTSDIFARDLDTATGTVRGDAVRLVDTFLGSNVNPATSPDGASLAYHRRTTTANQWSQIVIRSLATGAERVIPTVFRYAGPAWWLPDGNSLIQPARNKDNHATLYRVDLKSGDVSVAVETGKLGNGFALSPDGRRAYVRIVASARSHVEIYDLASGQRTGTSQLGNTRGVAASPDGRSIALVIVDGDPATRAQIVVADADGANARPVLATEKPADAAAFNGSLVKWGHDIRFIYFVRWNKSELWRVPAAGGAPTMVGELAKSAVRQFEITRDGRRVVFGTDARPTVEVWTLENLLPKASTTARR